MNKMIVCNSARAKVYLQNVFSKAGLKKSLVLVLVAIVTLPILCAPVRAWEPDQHVGMANIVLGDLLHDSTPGKVTIKGVDYSVSQLVYNAINSYPLYYKFGCIGPDGFPDIIIGQCAIHTGKGTEESSMANVYSYEWFDHMLSEVYSQNDWEMSLKAIAFTYGFMSHAAGDMFCHTFVNGYTGGVWQLTPDPTNAIRHVLVEAYMDKKTGWKSTLQITPDENNSFYGDTAFRDWMYSTMLDNDWVRAHTSGDWMGLINTFVSLRDKLDSWIDAWWANPETNPLAFLIPPVIWVPPFPPVGGYTIADYFTDWRNSINDGLEAWVGVSTQVAYDLFISGDTDAANRALSKWFDDYFLKMLGTPKWVTAIIDLVSEVKDAIDWINNHVLQPFRDLYDSAKDAVVNWLFNLVFGFTLDDLKDYLKNPGTYLDTPLFADAPYGQQTKEAIDSQFAFAMQSGSFNPWAFDPTYNTIMMSKLLLLDGAGLNKLLKDNGVTPLTPLYREEQGTTWQSLTHDGMCAMRGFMKSLDSDYQWMLKAPNGNSYGIGMPMWENQNAKELVFKKIFHLGLDMDMTPALKDIVPGETGAYDVKVINNGNTHDTFALSVNGLPTTWSYQFSASIIGLDAGTSTHVTLNVVPYRHWSTAPGNYSFTVTGISQNPWLTYDLVPTKIEDGIVHVLPFYEPHVVVTPKTSTTKPGGTKVYTINVTDFGNVPDSFSLAVQYLDFGTKYRALPTAIQLNWTTIDKTGMGPLAPGAFDIATLTISVPAEWVGMENTTYEFNATATSLGDTHVPKANKTETANLVVQATQASMTRYIDLELQSLMNKVGSSTLCQFFKDYLKISVLMGAIKLERFAFSYILNGKQGTANYWLGICRQTVLGFMSCVMDLKQCGMISTATANDWIANAKTIANDLSTAIATPL
jgi:hypothetical protein